MKTLRIWFACSLGLAISILLDWDLGFLAILLPLFVLGISDKINVSLLAIIMISAVFTTTVASVIWEVFKHYPVVLFLLVGILFLSYCIAMTNKKTFIIGYMGLIVGSIILNLSSYPFMDVEELCITVWAYSLSNIFICALAYYLFPEPVKVDIEDLDETDESSYVAKQVMMVWFVVMAALFVFQFADLYDSVAAHASILVILIPMTCSGAIQMAKVRIIGTTLGCLAGLIIHLVLGLWLENAFLYWLLFTIAMGPFCYWQTQGVVKSALSTSAMAALTVPLTTALIPGERDAFYAILYRFSSIFIAVLLSAICIFLIQKTLEHHALKKTVKVSEI
ncbi:DUF2955 domain-containing protein [Vibrio chagasii]|uniref:DUF2955 domain-containing protein n=1 Tax=Vibrio chagasii TaxID=170679 RepID=UPI0022847927|nr:DUF2955 domain-containing protein [Vibrio chagasii]MCY9824543.1 DUF2955 domain-containing protein [Vibrio chagasii]